MSEWMEGEREERQRQRKGEMRTDGAGWTGDPTKPQLGRHECVWKTKRGMEGKGEHAEGQKTTFRLADSIAIVSLLARGAAKLGGRIVAVPTHARHS
jgi:hypothetical protein